MEIDMKIRQGFVSNSSSTSFIIYGFHFDDGPLESMRTTYKEMYELSDDDMENCNGSDIFDSTIEDNLIDEIKCFYGEETNYIGISWGSIKDDETGKQFKDRIYNSIKKILPEISIDELSTYEESGYNG